jgi:hypothetical protein
MNPSNAAAFLFCCYCNLASMLAVCTALALITHTAISAFITSLPTETFIHDPSQPSQPAAPNHTELLHCQASVWIDPIQWICCHVSWSSGALHTKSAAPPTAICSSLPPSFEETLLTLLVKSLLLIALYSPSVESLKAEV